MADGCDAGIRIGESLAEHMVAVPITPALEMAVVATPDYFRCHPPPVTPEDLSRHDCLRFRQAGGGVHPWEFSAPDGGAHDFTVVPAGRFITNDDDGMIRAALQGAGLMQHIDIAVRPHLESGALVRVLQAWCKPFAGFYLYAPARAQMPAKVRALIDFLVEKREAMAAPVTAAAGKPRRKRAARARKAA